MIDIREDFEDEKRYQDVKNSVATAWLISFEHIRRLDPFAAEYLSNGNKGGSALDIATASRESGRPALATLL